MAAFFVAPPRSISLYFFVVAPKKSSHFLVSKFDSVRIPYPKVRDKKLFKNFVGIITKIDNQVKPKFDERLSQRLDFVKKILYYLLNFSPCSFQTEKEKSYG